MNTSLIVKIAVGAGVAAVAAVKNPAVRRAAVKAKGAISKLFAAPDYSNRRAPHIVIDGLDTVDDYVYLKSDADFAVRISKRVEHDLRWILSKSEGDRTSLYDLLNEASQKKVFKNDEELFTSLNNSGWHATT